MKAADPVAVGELDTSAVFARSDNAGVEFADDSGRVEFVDDSVCRD
jgi:hypothetical protein